MFKVLRKFWLTVPMVLATATVGAIAANASELQTTPQNESAKINSILELSELQDVNATANTNT